MNYINRARRTGKTTLLIHAAYVTGYPILVFDSRRADCVSEQAKKMGFDIEVFSLEEFKRVGHNYRKKVLIDEAIDFIERALSEAVGAEVIACSLSLPYYEPKETSEVQKDD